jgi:ankyrin repeat protein
MEVRDKFELTGIAYDASDITSIDEIAAIKERLTEFPDLNILVGMLPDTHLPYYGTSFLERSIGKNTPFEFYEWLFETYNIEVDFASESGSTALMAAAEKGRLDLVQFLVERGANVNAQTDPECIDQLYLINRLYLTHGSRINIEIDFSLTPICYALINEKSFETGKNIIIYLKSRGALVNGFVQATFNALLNNFPEFANTFHRYYDSVLSYGKVYFPSSKAGEIMDAMTYNPIQFSENGKHNVIAGFNYTDPTKIDTFKAGIITRGSYKTWRDMRRAQGNPMIHPPSTRPMPNANVRFYNTNAYNDPPSSSFIAGKTSLQVTGENGNPYNIYFERYAGGGKRKQQKTKKRKTKKQKTKKRSKTYRYRRN